MERRDSGEGEARLRRDSSDQKGDQKGDGIVTAFTIALLWLPSILIPVVIQLMRCDECWAEPTAAFVCQIIVMPFVVLPVMVIVAIILLPSLVPRPVASLAVIWFIWNAHTIGLTLCIVPFILASYHTKHTYSDILYDFFVFYIFVQAPLILCSGGLKLFSNKMGWGWGWPQRAVLGSYCIVVTVSMWAGQYYVRPHAVTVTIFTCALFYTYTVFTMLPPTPSQPAPEVSGVREWPAFRQLMAPVWALATSYLRIKLIEDKGEPGAGPPACAFEPGRPTVAGFHPHGVIPYTAGLITMSKSWRERYATVPHVLTDFFTHLIPLMRDIAQWVGGREVSRDAISTLLGAKEAVMLVPGGQQEIFSTRSWGREVFIYKGHKGFVRMALRHRARLVPILSMGEWELMDNVSWPIMQRATRKVLGFPVPFAPHGAYNLPMPNRPKHGLHVIVGQPIDYVCEQAESFSDEPPLCVPSEADVNRAHTLFYEALHSMFERHKANCGYPDHTLVMLDSPSGLERHGISASSDGSRRCDEARKQD